VPHNLLDKLARLAIAWWAALAAAAAAVAAFYVLLSKYTQLVPHIVESTDTLTVILNICMFIGLAVLFAVASTFALGGVWGGVSETGFFSRLFCAFFNSFVGYALRHEFPNNHFLRAVGIFLYIMAVLVITPLNRMFSNYEEKLMSAIFFFSIAYFVLNTNLHIFVWRFVTSDPDFRVVHSSSLGFWGWLSTIIGAGIYLGIYALFQIWYTNGKWWKQLRHPDSSL
jgi:hypothetical protein